MFPFNLAALGARLNRNPGRAFLAAVGLIMSCCSPPPQRQELFGDTQAIPVSVTLTPGDVVDVKFYYTPEMNESQQIRPDGKISLQLLGDISVIGKTPDQVRGELIAAYGRHLKDPDVAVILRSMTERRVYVGGEVNRPGVLSLPGSLTVLEAIMEAGGFNAASARLQNVVIIRRRDEKWRGQVVDLSKPLAGKDINPCELRPRDIVYVPRSPIVKVNQWVDQYVNKIIPTIVSSTAGNYFFGQWFYNKVK